MLLRISVISSSNTFQFLPTEYCEQLPYFVSMQLIFYCWLQLYIRGDLTSVRSDTTVLMTFVYCCRCMMGGTNPPEKLVATAVPIHRRYARRHITCTSNSVQTYLLMDEVSISITKQVRVRLLLYFDSLCYFSMLEKLYFSMLDKWGRRAKMI